MITFRMFLEASEKKREFLSNKYNIPISEIEYLDRIDPTNGKALEWIVKMYIKQILRFPEDEEKTKSSLTTFFKLKDKKDFKGNKDINTYKSYGALANIIHANNDVKSNKEKEEIKIVNGLELLNSKENYKLWKVTTPEAGLSLGWRDTEWCVKDPKYFNQYGPPFYCITINDKPEYLANFNKEIQIMNKWDDPVSFKMFKQLGMDPWEEFKEFIKTFNYEGGGLGLYSLYKSMITLNSYDITKFVKYVFVDHGLKTSKFQVLNLLINMDYYSTQTPHALFNYDDLIEFVWKDVDTSKTYSDLKTLLLDHLGGIPNEVAHTLKTTIHLEKLAEIIINNNQINNKYISKLRSLDFTVGQKVHRVFIDKLAEILYNKIHQK